MRNWLKLNVIPDTFFFFFYSFLHHSSSSSTLFLKQVQKSKTVRWVCMILDNIIILNILNILTYFYIDMIYDRTGRCYRGEVLYNLYKRCHHKRKWLQTVPAENFNSHDSIYTRFVSTRPVVYSRYVGGNSRMAYDPTKADENRSYVMGVLFLLAGLRQPPGSWKFSSPTVHEITEKEGRREEEKERGGGSRVLVVT